MIISIPSSFFVQINYSRELIIAEKANVTDKYRGKEDFKIYEILDEEYAESKSKSE